MKARFPKAALLLMLAFTLFSFSTPPGGEGFEVFLNNKMIMQRFGNQLNSPQSIQLSDASANDEITIKYHHCGRVGKKRVLTIKDGQEKVLKEIRFADVNNPVSGMSCKVKDIISLKKANNTVLKLYYTSSELPNGRLLASIITGSKTSAGRP
ncbi:MAG TPA: hypothetical protein PK092_12645 [Chitinophagaceae bacterium]|nr:hypothetical protein [Chitinophagaceae bacterium]